MYRGIPGGLSMTQLAQLNDAVSYFTKNGYRVHQIGFFTSTAIGVLAEKHDLMYRFVKTKHAIRNVPV